MCAYTTASTDNKPTIRSTWTAAAAVAATPSFWKKTWTAYATAWSSSNAEGGRLPKEAVLAGESGAAPRAVLLPGTRIDLHQVPTVAQQAKVNAARAQAEATRPVEG
jgi:hypothetical protein